MKKKIEKKKERNFTLIVVLLLRLIFQSSSDTLLPQTSPESSLDTIDLLPALTKETRRNINIYKIRKNQNLISWHDTNNNYNVKFFEKRLKDMNSLSFWKSYEHMRDR